MLQGFKHFLSACEYLPLKGRVTFHLRLYKNQFI